MPNPITAREVQALRDAGWRPLREILAGLPVESRISEHTFLKSWRPARLIPRSIEPRIFRGYGPGRGSSLSLWPPTTKRFIQAAWELQQYVSSRGRRPRQKRSASADRVRSTGAHGALLVALWSIGYKYDPELIRTTLVQELRRFEALVRNRGEQLSGRRSPTTDVPSRSLEDALEDLVSAHQARIIKAGLEPENVERELSLLLSRPAGSESLLDRMSTAVSGATLSDLEGMRTEARTLLLLYLSHESSRRQIARAISSASPDLAAMGLGQLSVDLQTEYAQLDHAWRHLIHFPVLTAFLIYSQHSPDPEIVKWRTLSLPQYAELISWDTLPTTIREAARSPGAEHTDSAP